MPKIKLYWWNEEPNFGDALNPYLVAKLTNQEVVWSRLEDADMVAAGSLLQWVAKIENKLTKPLHVWGSGYMFDKEPAVTNPLVKHHAVRGRKSQIYGNLENVALGDAGLLADILINKPDTKYAIGIVPHLWHLSDPTLRSILEREKAIRLIDVRLDPLTVIRQIAECDFIFSSSLHGLIVADSFGIPNQWVHFKSPLFGGDWKFNDYYSIFNNEQSALLLREESSLVIIANSVIQEYSRPGLDILKHKLIESLPLLV